MKKEFDLANLNRYVKPASPDFGKAMRDVSDKYEKIKDAIKILVENYYNDKHDFNIRTSQRVSKVFLKNNLDNIKSILTDDTTIDDFVASLDISLNSLSIASSDNKEDIKDYVLFHIEKILKNESKEEKTKPAYISVSTIEEKKDVLRKNFIAANTSAFAPRLKNLSNTIKLNSAIISSVSTNLSFLNLKLKGTALKLSMVKMKNTVLGVASNIIGKTTNFLKKGLGGIADLLKRIGTFIVSGLVALGTGLKKLIGGFLGFVGKILTGAIMGVIWLVKNVFGLFLKGALLVLTGIVFLFKLAIKAVVVALEIIGGIIFFIGKGVFATISWIVSGVAHLLKLHKNIIKKAIKGIFASLGVFLFTRKGAFFLGMIAGFTWKYIILPISHTIGNTFELMQKAWTSLSDFINKPEEDEEEMSESEKESLLEKSLESVKESSWFKAFSQNMRKVLDFSQGILDNVFNSLSVATNFIKNIPNMILGYAATMGGAYVGTFLGSVVGSYFGPFGTVLGSAIGALIGGAVGYLFESNKQIQFNKIENPDLILEEYGAKPNIMSTSGKKAYMPTPLQTAEQNILMNNMKQGAVPEESRFKYSEEQIVQMLKDFETAKEHTSMTESRNVGKYFEPFKSAMTSNLKLKGTKFSVEDFSLEIGKDEMVKKLKEHFDKTLPSKEEEKQQVLKHELLTLFRSARRDLMNKFHSNKFISSRLGKYDWGPGSETMSTEQAADELTAQIYSMYEFSSYLYISQALMSGFLRKNAILDETTLPDPYAPLRWLMMFATNSTEFNKISVEDFHDFYKRIQEDTRTSDQYSISSPQVMSIFKTKNWLKKTGYVYHYIDTLLKNPERIPNIDSELYHLIGNHTKNMISEENFQNWKNERPQSRKKPIGLLLEIQKTFDEYFSQFGIESPSLKSAVIREVFARCMEKTNLDFSKSFFENTGDNVMSKMLSAFSIENIKKELSVLEKSGNVLQQSQTDLTNLYQSLETEKFEQLKNAEQKELEVAFDWMVAKILDDSELDTKEQQTLDKIMKEFPESDVVKIIKKLLQKYQARSEKEEKTKRDIFVWIDTEYPEKSSSEDSEQFIPMQLAPEV